jgi:hypothetical protein
MRLCSLVVAAALATGSAAAQGLAPPGTLPGTIPGARPGHVPGVGESLPRSDRASNIGTGTMREVAPSLPQPAIGDAASVPDYVNAAREALAGGRTGLAQQSLEMAETRLLDRVVPGGVIAPSDQEAVMRLRRAREALGAGQREQAMQILDTLRAN